jgi:hypothetical protein
MNSLKRLFSQILPSSWTEKNEGDIERRAVNHEAANPNVELRQFRKIRRSKKFANVRGAQRQYDENYGA